MIETVFGVDFGKENSLRKYTIPVNDVWAREQLLIEILSYCDPREDYGEGMVCQFCLATEKETHKDDCIYKRLTNS